MTFKKRFIILIRIFLLTITISCCSMLNAQNYQIEKTLTIEDGLPSEEIYSTFFDDNGNLWILTDKGLAKYDGFEFKIFTTKQGLPSNVVLKHFEDTINNRHWFTTTNGLCYIQNDSIITPSFNRHFNNYPWPRSVNALNFGSQNKLYISFEGLSLYYFTAFANEDTLIHHKTGLSPEKFTPTDRVQKRVIPYNYLYLKDNISFISTSPMKVEEVDTSFGYSDSIWVFSSMKSLSYIPKHSKTYTQANGTFYYSLDKQVYKINYQNGELEKVFSTRSKILSLAKSGKIIYASLYNDGVYAYNLKTNKGLFILEGVSVSSVNCYFNKLIVSTLNNGVYFLNLSAESAFKIPKNRYGGENFAKPYFFDGSKLKLFKNGSVLEYIFNDSLQKPLERTFSLVNFGGYNRMYWYNNDSALLAYHQINYIKKTVVPRPNPQKIDVSFVKVSKINAAKTYYFGKEGFFVLKDDSTYFNSMNSGEKLVVNDICEITEDSVLIACENGLYLFNDHTVSKFNTNNAILDTAKAKTIERFGSNFYAIGTSGNGLFIIKNEKILHFHEGNGLLGNFISCLMGDLKDTLWIGTNKNLQYLFQDTQKLKLSGSLFKTNVEHIYNTKKGLYIHNDKDFISVDRHFLLPARPKILSVTTGINDNNIYSKKRLFALRKGETFKIIFQLNEIFDHTYSLFKLKLSPNETEWTTTKENFRIFNNLPFGKYTLQIKGRSSSGQWSDVEELNFEVIPLFYQYKWFQPLLFVFIGLAIGGVGLSFQRERSKRYAQQNVMLQSSLSALKLQINPHFIFNALNSLQYLILSNKKKKSTEFLGQFSHLVRDVLDNSQQTYIALNEEIERLKTYLKLEEVRMEKGLIVMEIVKDEDLKLNQMLFPNMILQPIVENAIWHGLVSVKIDPKLIIRVYKKDNTKCVVEIMDNGKGIDVSELEAKQNNGSLAIKNIQERLFLFSRLEKKEFSIQFEATDPGTKVTITVPLMRIKE